MEKNFKESHPRIEINIGERIVSVTCYISIKDIGYFIESKNLKSSEIVLGILNNHIDTKEKIELLKISKSDIENFIDDYDKRINELAYGLEHISGEKVVSFNLELRSPDMNKINAEIKRLEEILLNN